jgi:hypothetical protein
MRFFIWIVELKIKRKENKQRIKYLALRLIKELELQGYNTKGTTDCKYVSIFEFKDEITMGGSNGTQVTVKLEEKE